MPSVCMCANKIYKASTMLSFLSQRTVWLQSNKIMVVNIFYFSAVKHCAITKEISKIKNLSIGLM